MQQIFQPQLNIYISMWKVLLFRRSGTVQELKIGSRARLVWNKNCHFLVVWSLVNVLASPCFLTCKWNNSIYCHSTVQSLSRVWLFVTPWTVACQASLFTTNSSSLLKLMSIESAMPFNHLILCYRLLLPPSIFPDIRVFSSESVLHIRWPKYWSTGSIGLYFNTKVFQWTFRTDFL